MARKKYVHGSRKYDSAWKWFFGNPVVKFISVIFVLIVIVKVVFS